MSSMKQLLESLQRIDEADPAPAPVAAQAAAPDEEARFAANNKKQEDSKAQAALVTKLQGMLLKRDDPNTASKGYFIDPTNGLIGYASPYGGGKQNGGGDGRPEMLRFDQVDTGIHKAVKQLLTSAGLTVVSSKNIPGILNYSGGYASIPMDQVKMIQSGKLPNQTQPAVAAQPAATSVASAAPAPNADAASVQSQEAPAPALGSQPPTASAENEKLKTNIAANQTYPQAQQAQVQSAPAGLADRNAKIKDLTDLLAKYPTLKEFAFKSRIGQALLESFDLKLDEKVAIGSTAGETTEYTTPSGATFYASAPLTKEEATKRIKDLVFYFKDSKFKDDKEVQDLITKALGMINTPADNSGAMPVASADVKQDNSGATPVASAEKKTIPDAQAVTAAGNHPEKGTDAQSYAAVNRTTGAMYNNDTIGPGSRDTGTDHRVSELQKRLGITPQTGVYGPAEKKAVEDLQKRLGVNVDGKFGPETKDLFDKDKTGNASSGRPHDNVAQNGTGDKTKTTFDLDSSGYPSDPSKPVPPRPTDPNDWKGQQNWDRKYASGWNPDGSSKKNNSTQVADAGQNNGTADKTKNAQRPGMDPKGKPEVYDRQKQLAELGAKNKDGTALKTDGVKGNDTVKAEKDFGHLLIDPKSTITVNGTTRPVNPADIKNIRTWITAVKDGKKKPEEIPPVYADIVKKQVAIKESYGNIMYNEDQTLARIIQLSR